MTFLQGLLSLGSPVSFVKSVVPRALAQIPGAGDSRMTHPLPYLESPSPTLGCGPWARLVHSDPSLTMIIFPVVSWVLACQNKLLENPEMVTWG